MLRSRIGFPHSKQVPRPTKERSSQELNKKKPTWKNGKSMGLEEIRIR